MKRSLTLFCIVALLLCVFAGCQPAVRPTQPTMLNAENESVIPAFSGAPYVALNGNIPTFTQKDYTTDAYEYYSELDRLNRCGYVMACIGQELMPTEERGSIGQVKPTGWQTVKYDHIDGKYLYNRCHLIGYQLTGENANEKNLITGTRFLNIEGMLPFENMVADYVRETGNHVLYRVTPVFEGEDMLAKGVIMEGWSVEDEGEGICFHVFAYNAQPGVWLDYATGDSKQAPAADTEDSLSSAQQYILNTNSKKYHEIDCTTAQNISQKNKEIFNGTAEELAKQGYTAAGCCHP